MDKKTRRALFKVLAYLYADERKDYEAQDDEAGRRGHIYLDIVRVSEWLEHFSEADEAA